MNILKITSGLAMVLLIASCNSTKHITIPTTTELPVVDENNYTVIWQGNSEAYKYVDGVYKRIENYDYTFEVVQRRYGNIWKSTKTMHRLHPDFPGNGKTQNKTMYFEVEFTKEDDEIKAKIQSSEGIGVGVSDAEFREQAHTITFDISKFAPFNTMRLVQHYNYEEGKLIETVEIFKLKEGKETPFMKMEEVATIFRPQLMENAPTRFE